MQSSRPSRPGPTPSRRSRRLTALRIDIRTVPAGLERPAGPAGSLDGGLSSPPIFLGCKPHRPNRGGGCRLRLSCGWRSRVRRSILSFFVARPGVEPITRCSRTHRPFPGEDLDHAPEVVVVVGTRDGYIVEDGLSTCDRSLIRNGFCRHRSRPGSRSRPAPARTSTSGTARRWGGLPGPISRGRLRRARGPRLSRRRSPPPSVHSRPCAPQVLAACPGR